jgi:hypothetical protein
MGCVERDRERKRRRARKLKLVKFRALFAKAANDGERGLIFAKARKVSPLITVEELAPTAAKT